MLIEFKVSNFRSICDTQTFSMVASTGRELPQNICSSDIDSDLQLIRSAVIYGPNAAGKSNFIKALGFMRKLILESAKESQQGEKIHVESFLFDEKTSQLPSEFEINFTKENIRYQYGFVVNKFRIIEEWLLAYPSGRPQRWFSRKYDKKIDNDKWEFSPNFKGGKKQHELWKSSTRNNALFLSAAVQLNNEQLSPIFSWFQKDLVVIPASREIGPGKSIDQIKNSNSKQQIMKYMTIADPSITDIEVKFGKFSEKDFDASMPQEIKEYLKKDYIGKEIVEIKFKHPNNAFLNFGNESDGTQKFFGLAGYWINCLKNGQVIIVDELNNSLHPLAVKFLINLMSNPEINKKNSQLIFSTHDTSLLDDEIFRRDQIWFAEKDAKHSTQLYPLLDFSPRKNEAIGKGYLEGRYGALPYIGDWKF